jgi:predicted Rossmann fold flavoprotein
MSHSRTSDNLLHCDVLVIGGGPAGLMASVAAAEHGARVILLEKGDRLGRKLLISGGGRCNVTNAKELNELIRNIPGNGKFMYSSLHQFGNQHIIQFFENLGIRLKEEDNGRMFPVTDKAKTVLDSLLNYMKRLNVEIRLNHPVSGLILEEHRCCGAQTVDGSQFRSLATIVAVGGCSVPKTGSTGDGYKWAEAAGHTIIPPYPTEVGITTDAAWRQQHDLQGLSLRQIELTLYGPNGKKISRETGDMIFTHYGISGPAALRSSHYVVTTLQKTGPVVLRLTLDLFPGHASQDLLDQILQVWKEQPKKTIRNILKGMIPERLIGYLLSYADCPAECTYDHASKHKLYALTEAMKSWPILVNGTLPLEQATVTGGGVSIKEIDPKTMQSKLCSGLYFAGEVMDVHAHTGGYNITVAFSSGYTAGQAAAKQSKVQAEM